MSMQGDKMLANCHELMQEYRQRISELNARIVELVQMSKESERDKSTAFSLLGRIYNRDAFQNEPFDHLTEIEKVLGYANAK